MGSRGFLSEDFLTNFRKRKQRSLSDHEGHQGCGKGCLPFIPTSVLAWFWSSLSCCLTRPAAVMLTRQVLTATSCTFRQSLFAQISARKMSTDKNSEVVCDIVNGKGVIRLNRPKALNALNMNMINNMFPVLQVKSVNLSVLCFSLLPFYSPH